MQRASRRRSPAQHAAKAERSKAAEGGLRVGVGGAVVIKPNHATHLPPRPQAKRAPASRRRSPAQRAAKAERSKAAEGGLRVGVGGAVVIKPTRRTALPTPPIFPPPHKPSGFPRAAPRYRPPITNAGGSPHRRSLVCSV